MRLGVLVLVRVREGLLQSPIDLARETFNVHSVEVNINQSRNVRMPIHVRKEGQAVNWVGCGLAKESNEDGEL